MKHLMALVAAGLGAAATMYYFDPDSGSRRRARLIERLGGLGPADRHPAWEPDAADEAADAKLRERVRARLDDLVSHPRAIHVQVDDCVVRLSGRVLATEMHGLLTQVRDMPGVRRVINAMSAQDSPHHIAGAPSTPEELEVQARAHPT